MNRLSLKLKTEKESERQRKQQVQVPKTINERSKDWNKQRSVYIKSSASTPGCSPRVIVEFIVM